jgi:DnaJ homolog subfamily C member 9
MSHIPHSTYEDEPRIITVVKKLIKSKAITSLPKWEADVKDEKAKKARKKRGQQEAVEAEETAKELGVWDEFYGSGSKGKRGGSKKKDQDDTANLQALIQKRAANRGTGSFLDNLAAKYGALEDPMDEDEAPKAKSKGRRKKRSREEEEDEGPTKKSRKTPELDDAEFERIQQRLEAEKAKKAK